jgi:hypothetical protein
MSTKVVLASAFIAALPATYHTAMEFHYSPRGETCSTSPHPSNANMTNVSLHDYKGQVTEVFSINNSDQEHSITTHNSKYSLSLHENECRLTQERSSDNYFKNNIVHLKRV